MLSDWALRLDGVTVKDHFGSDGFSANKRMFLTILHKENLANIRLSPEAQRRFLSLDGEGFSEVNDRWGHQGWTRVHLEFVDRSDLAEALKAAWEYSKVKTGPTPLGGTSKKKTAKRKKAARKKVAKRVKASRS